MARLLGRMLSLTVLLHSWGVATDYTDRIAITGILEIISLDQVADERVMMLFLMKFFNSLHAM